MARVLLSLATMTMLGGYRLGTQLGAGGMGVVYEGLAPDGARVAVKVLRSDRRDEPAARRRFRDEAIAAQLVSHPNLISVLDSGEVEGIPFLVMPLIEGVGLGARVRDSGALPLPESLAIALQVLDGLAALHATAIVHGDIKSDNILVSGSHPTLIDFGLASVDPGTSRRPRKQTFVLGTPEYMAPEVAWGDAPTARTDVYAMGCVLYELVTGSTPFGGGSSREILRRQLSDPVVPPSLRDPDGDVPPALERVMLRALAKPSTLRFADAGAFRDALAIAGRSVTSDRAGTFRCRAATLDLPRAHSSSTTARLEPVHAA